MWTLLVAEGRLHDQASPAGGFLLASIAQVFYGVKVRSAWVGLVRVLTWCAEVVAAPDRDEQRCRASHLE